MARDFARHRRPRRTLSDLALPVMLAWVAGWISAMAVLVWLR